MDIVGRPISLHLQPKTALNRHFYALSDRHQQPARREPILKLFSMFTSGRRHLTDFWTFVNLKGRYF